MAVVERVEVQVVGDTDEVPTHPLRVLIVQNVPGTVHWDRLDRVVQTYTPGLVILPEYAWYGVRDYREGAQLYETLLTLIQTRTRTWWAWVVGGTLMRSVGPEGLESVCCLFYRGEVRGVYRKINPTGRERRSGMRPGNVLTVWQVGTWRWAPLVCADVFCRTAVAPLLGGQDVHLVVVPTASPHRPGEPVSEKFVRDQTLFQALAQDVQAPVVKCCCVGRLFGHPFQGRSLVAAPTHILWRVPPEEENRPRTVCIDITDRRVLYEEVGEPLL